MFSVNLIDTNNDIALSHPPSNKLNLKKFDIMSLKFDCKFGFAALIIGKRGVGKSFLIKDIMHYNQDIPCGQVVTSDVNRDMYDKMIPNQFIHQEYKPGIIHDMIKRRNNNEGDDPCAFLIFDNCIYSKSFFNDKTIKNVYISGRNNKLITINAISYPLHIPPAIRTSMNYVFIFSRIDFFISRGAHYNSTIIFFNFSR